MITWILTVFKPHFLSGSQVGLVKSLASSATPTVAIRYGKALHVKTLLSSIKSHSGVITASATALVAVSGVHVATSKTEVKATTSLANSVIKGSPRVLASVPPPAPSPSLTVQPKQLGINVSNYANWTNERSFANLTMGGYWMRSMWWGSWSDMDPARVAEDGSVKSLQNGERAFLSLTVPAHSATGVRIRCTYAGAGKLYISGDATNVVTAPGSIEFSSKNTFPNPARPYLVLEETKASNPIRQIDCREANLPKNRLFAPEFIDSLKPFGVIRFLDWQKINENRGGKWSRRSRPNSFVVNPVEGVAVEHMVALANEADADPWLLMPYNADEEFVTKFAQYVHDNLEPGRKAYVELSNEVWNWGFPVQAQAMQEAVSTGLDTAPTGRAAMRRYSQKASAAFKIWTRIFADNPSRLVRVIATQHANPGTATDVLTFGDVAQYTDALATAPYFGHDLLPGGTSPKTIDELMLTLAQKADWEIDFTSRNKAIATQYNLRHIAYEGGQHVYSQTNVPLLTQINRHPRMYDIYARYIRRWHEANNNDVMVLYNSTIPINQWGAWGLREYSGQPLSQTPKRRAAFDYAAAN